ncbi:MAG TPA: sialidase family protein [Kribbella sp.]|uniref:sialidase family protein n=1 Tax=Kribbella sp. TaxID=1871183 RepID=UPI002D76B326|nr:sialidase family protein [Kribbella sp.]HET6298605.1 sialidase family protein [Kribbella sp.]
MILRPRRTSSRRSAVVAVVALGALAATFAGTPAATARPTPTEPPTAQPAVQAAAQSGKPATQPFIDDSVLFQQKSEGYACFRIPAIVRTTAGTLLAFAEGRVADCGDDGDIDLVLKRSFDDGKTWGPLQLVSAGNGDTHGNPVPIVDAKTGRIVLISTHNDAAPCPNGCDRDPYVQTSDDDGATWTADRELTDAKLPAWNFWYATGPMHGIQLEHGRHAGRLVVPASYEIYDGVGKHVYGTHLLYSDDAGETWHIGATTSRDDGKVIAQEVTIAELTDGRIYALARERGTDVGSRASAISSDGGDSWDAPFKVMPSLAMPDVQGSLLRLTARNEGDRRNRLLFSAPANPAAREAMTIRSSYDEARSWGTWQQGKVFWWGPSAYSDMVKLPGDQAALFYEAGVASPYESIRFARFNEAYLATPNGTPPGIPGPPAPGPQTRDLSPAHNPAYVRGEAVVAPGKYGNGIALDGVDDRVEVPFDRSIDVGADDFTMMAWIKYGSSTAAQSILWAYRQGSGTTSQVWLRAEPANKRIVALLAVQRFNITIQSASPYNDNQWHQVVVQRAGGKFKLLVDGVEVGSADAPPGSASTGQEFGIQGIHVGQRVDGANRFNGTIDEVRVYRRALSTTELDQIRLTNKPITSKLGLRLPFDSIH